MNVVGFCGACGTMLAPAVRFCQVCGVPVQGQVAGSPAPPQPPQPVEVTMGRSTNPYACPRCREVDAARRVSSIVSDATATGTIRSGIVGGGHQFGAYGGTIVSAAVLNATTASQSVIGRTLSPPERPVPPKPWGRARIIALRACPQTHGPSTLPSG